MPVYGLDNLDRLIETLKNLPKEMLKSADTSMVNNSAELLAYNRDQIENYGTDSETKPLRYKHKRKGKVSGVYTKAYDRFKGKYGGNTAYVDLKLSGDFLNSLMLDHKTIGKFRIYSESKVFASGTILEDELIWNYGKDIFGLWEANLQKFADENMKPEIENDLNHLIDRIV